MKSSEKDHGTTNHINDITPLPMATPEAMKSLLEQGTKLQAETMMLWNHRTQAWLNWPKKMLECRNSTDVAAAQGAFITTLQRHYKEYFDSVLHGPAFIHGDDPKPGVEEVHRKAA